MNLRRDGSIHGRDRCGAVRHQDLRDQIGLSLIWHTLPPLVPVRSEGLGRPAPIGLEVKGAAWV